jgi:hypothetical protein
MQRKIFRAVVVAGFIMALPVQVFSFGKRDTKQIPDAPLYETAVSGQTVEVSGLVRLVGSEPFPDMVLADTDEHIWYIAPGDRKILSSYEQRTVTIRGTVELMEMVLANGKSLGTRRILSDISIVKVW